MGYYARLLVWLTLILAAVIVPFLLWEGRFAALTREWLDESRPNGTIAGAVALLLASDILLPIPSSLISTTGGYLLGFWRGLAASWLGMTVACCLGYALGRFAGGLARRLVSEEEYQRSQQDFARRGDWVLAGSRAVPVLAEASVVVAGLLARPFQPFLWVCAWANLGISVAYAAVGAFAVRAESFLIAFAGAIVVPWIAMRLFRRPQSGGEAG